MLRAEAPSDWTTRLTDDGIAQHRWRLRILDGFELSGPSGPVDLPPAGARLLALLAIHGPSVQRTRVAGTLWPDTTDRQANANLRSLLWRTVHHHQGLVEATSTRVWLGTSMRIDLWRCRHRARALVEERLVPDAADIDLQAAELLPDWYDDWVIIEREREHQRRLHTLEALCTWFIRHDEYALGLDAGLAAIAADPLRESAHRAVISAHLAEGNCTEALRQYRVYAGILDRELGLQPSPAMKDLLPVVPPR